MVRDIQVSPELVLSSLGCAFHMPTSSLILADLHLGYEATLESEGFAMPRLQTDEMFKRFAMAAELYEPSIIVIAGDLKHNFDRNLDAEWREVEDFIELAESKGKIVALKGNHDNFLATILSRHKLHLKREILVGNIRIQHGHERTEPWGAGMIFGHEHPSLRLTERTGASIKIPCFLYCRSLNRLVLPAFSTLAIGSDIVSTPDSERMIPLLSRTGIDDYEAFGFSKGEILNYRTIGELRAIGRI